MRLLGVRARCLPDVGQLRPERFAVERDTSPQETTEFPARLFSVPGFAVISVAAPLIGATQTPSVGEKPER